MKRKDVKIADFLTKAEIEKAKSLYIKHKPHLLCSILVDKIIGPNLQRINESLGQENDPRFLAYAVEYTFLKKMIKREQKGLDGPVAE